MGRQHAEQAWEPGVPAASLAAGSQDPRYKSAQTPKTTLSKKAHRVGSNTF